MLICGQFKQSESAIGLQDHLYKKEFSLFFSLKHRLLFSDTLIRNIHRHTMLSLSVGLSHTHSHTH